MASDEAPGGVRSGRVLIADDTPENVTLLERLLAQAGYADIRGCSESGELAATIERFAPDAILLDWHMPRPHGAEVLIALRKDDRWAEVPIIVITADNEARLRALELGATDFLTKPFDPTEVLLRVRNVLRTRALHRALERENEELERRVEERTHDLAVANEELRQAELVRRDFITMASHELRTPLTVIRGFVELWEQRGLPGAVGPLPDQLASVRRNVRRMEHLVHNLLLASRVETGSDGHRRRSFSLPDALESAVGIVDVPVTLECDIASPFEGDPGLVTLVVANLVSNAERYGEPPVGVRACEVPGGVEVTVDDAGPGVPEEFVPHLFERFSQATAGDRRTARGTGLGLWVSEHIVQLHGGRLWYEPRPSGGSRFVFRLPRPEYA